MVTQVPPYARAPTPASTPPNGGRNVNKRRLLLFREELTDRGSKNHHYLSAMHAWPSLLTVHILGMLGEDPSVIS